MYFDDKKKAVTLIMAKRGSKGERTMSPTPMKPEEVKTEDGEMDGRHAAAQDIIAAHGEASPMRLMEALSNFIDLHHAHSASNGESE